MSDTTRLTPTNLIPRGAWIRPIGLPHDTPGHPRLEGVPMIDDGPFNGAPLGGMGAGSIGRSFRGDFVRWHLDIGRHHYQSVPACMFSVFIQQGESKVTQALYTGAPDDDVLSAWQWDYPVGAGTYYALYPRSGFVYNWERFRAHISVEQFSPIIPDNYRESSLPVAIFNWKATNPTDEVMTVGIMFTWQNLIGTFVDRDIPAGQSHQPFEDESVRGVIMQNDSVPADHRMAGTMAIAALKSPGVSVTVRDGFRVKSDGADVWDDFAADGRLDDNSGMSASSNNDPYAAAVAVTFTLQPGQTLDVSFALAWDLPRMTFGSGTSWYRRYTNFYGCEGNHAADMARDALTHHTDWRQQVMDWQLPILDDDARPDWYKTALFNELYFLVDGATAWEHGQVGQPQPDNDYLGGFLYVESVDYPHYGTFDVDFYASFAMLELFPEIERRLIRDFAHATATEDLRDHHIVAMKEVAPRMLSGAVPHDLGGPFEDPWLQPNNYIWQDVNRWKDLNAKLVLRLYRDALLLNDDALIKEMWETAQLAMDYLNNMDRDGDGIPENEGIPDQTYDTWPVTGVSAYSGGLWLAALAACREMATIIKDDETAAAYDAHLKRASTVYEQKLWNGTYYKYDSSDSAYHDSIMSDQLCGQWYCDFLGIKLHDDARVSSALRTVYDFNVCQYGDGQMGAVNGMRPDGSIDTSDMQSEEMWTGTTYGLASFMLMRGMDDEAWATAYGVYNVTYNTSGMWFRTPEAYDINDNYRAGIYQRALTVWAIETALRLRTTS